MAQAIYPGEYPDRPLHTFINDPSLDNYARQAESLLARCRVYSFHGFSTNAQASRTPAGMSRCGKSPMSGWLISRLCPVTSISNCVLPSTSP